MRYWYYGVDTNPTHFVHEQSFKEGDLVSTLLGEYGIIIGQGPPADLKKVVGDSDVYYKVLIDGRISHYLSHGLKKIIKKLDI